MVLTHGETEMIKSIDSELYSETGRNVLLVGGSGYIGCPVTSALLGSGYKVRNLDLLTYAHQSAMMGHMLAPNYEFIFGNMGCASTLSEALDGITDVRNVGAIARSAELCGVHALVLPNKGGALINADALKTSAGALSRLAVCREPSLLTATRLLIESGVQVLAGLGAGDRIVLAAEGELSAGQSVRDE